MSTPKSADQEAGLQAGAPAAAAPARSGPPRRVLVIAALVGLAGAGFGGRLWWQSQNFAETDNAYLSGHVHPVSSRIPGVVTRVLVEDHASVQAGQALLVLDAADQQVQIERLQAQLVQLQSQIVGSAAQIAQARAQAQAAQAQVVQAAALQTRAERDVERAQRLAQGELRAISRQELDATVAARDAATADVAARRAAAGAAAESVRAAAAARDSAQAQQAVLQAQLKEAQQQLAYTTVPAAAAGRIGKRTVEVGQRVQPGQQLMAVVQEEVWITANFKETQLARMKAGQPATVRIDAVPGRELHARVHSFAPGSGASFALLPPDNATGNFTRIVQRVPVKLVFDAADAPLLKELRGRLVPGLSAAVTVDLREAR